MSRFSLVSGSGFTNNLNIGGLIGIKADGTDDPAIKKYFEINLGIDRDGVAGSRHVDALQSPTAYLKRRTEMLRELAGSHSDLFKKTVKQLEAAGYPSETAKEQAFLHVEKTFENDKHLTDILFPADFLSTDLQGGRLGGNKKEEKTTGATGAAAPPAAAPLVGGGNPP